MSASCPGHPARLGGHEEIFHHDGGISEFVEFLAADPAVTDIWRLHGSGKFKETVPVLDERGHSQLAEVERDCEVDMALRWGIGYESTVRSFVNIISTPKGGTHQSGFERPCSRPSAKQWKPMPASLRPATTRSRRTTFSPG